MVAIFVEGFYEKHDRRHRRHSNLERGGGGAQGGRCLQRSDGVPTRGEPVRPELLPVRRHYPLRETTGAFACVRAPVRARASVPV